MKPGEVGYRTKVMARYLRCRDRKVGRRVGVTLSLGTLAAVERYRLDSDIGTEAEALRRLVESGLQKHEARL